MSQSGVFQIGVDLLDDGESTMSIICRGRVYGAVVKKACTRWASNSVGRPSCTFGFSSGMRHITKPPGKWSAFFSPVNAVNATFGTSATEAHLPVVSSRMAEIPLRLPRSS